MTWDDTLRYLLPAGGGSAIALLWSMWRDRRGMRTDELTAVSGAAGVVTGASVSLLDQVQEELARALTRLDAAEQRLDRQQSQIDAVRRSERLAIEHARALHRHIEQALPPPPPAWPEALT